MQRHQALQDLSRDHFTAFNRALQMVRAVEGHPRAWPVGEAFAAFQALWSHGGLPAHFREEETDLVPVLRGHGAGHLADRLVREHDALRDGFAHLAPDDPVQAAATAEALRKHARWEEDVVFEWLQANLAEGDLQSLWAASRGFRSANGLPVGPPSKEAPAARADP